MELKLAPFCSLKFHCLYCAVVLDALAMLSQAVANLRKSQYTGYLERALILQVKVHDSFVFMSECVCLFHRLIFTTTLATTLKRRSL